MGRGHGGRHLGLLPATIHEQLLCTRLSTKPLYMDSFNLHTNPTEEGLLLSLLY